MRQSVRVLYLLREAEGRPPEALVRAAGSVHMIRAGSELDASTRDYGGQLVAFREPYDHDMRTALVKLSDLELPTLCFGSLQSDMITAHVTEHVSVDDLRTVIGLMAAVANEHMLRPTECRAEDMGQCRGRVTDQLIGLLEHLLTSRMPEYPERGQRVFEASLWIGNHLCLPPNELKDLVRAARLREIGKLGLPDRILFAHRNERSAGDQAAYDRYPELGARVLQELPQLRAAGTIVEHQLENFDGSGPHSLMAHQIPLGSRVLRVASVFCTLLGTEDREHSAKEVLGILEEGRGTLFDPLLVKLVENFSDVNRPGPQKRDTRMVRVADLNEDMILAEDVWSRTGMKIIPSGTRITPHILGLLRQFPLDPALESLQILR